MELMNKILSDEVLDYFEDVVKKKNDLPYSDVLKLCVQAREANALRKLLTTLSAGG